MDAQKGISTDLGEFLQLRDAVWLEVEKRVTIVVLLASVSWVEVHQGVEHMTPYTSLFRRVVNAWNRFPSEPHITTTET